MCSQKNTFYATDIFLPGNLTFRAKEILTEPNYLTVQLKEQQHILLTPEFLQYINHRCDPNVSFNITKRVLRCLSQIEVEEEKTFFYTRTISF